MNRILFVLGLAGLGLTIVPCGVAFAGAIDAALVKPLMLAGTVLWFATATWRDALQKPR